MNYLLILASSSIIPPPSGVIVTDGESIAEAMANGQYKPYHFIFPFLAHALGTLVGAFTASRIAASRKLLFALVIGLFFLISGILAAYWIPAPEWFITLDLVLAYIPMAWIGGKLFRKKKKA
ncbi:MAG: hypothetical protein WDZ35_13950 [Crocinitomicaceae bacterium]